jgi:hypothetical protein
VRSNRSQNKGRLRVRSEGQLSRESSKRVQTGEPIKIGLSNVRFAGHPISTLELARIVGSFNPARSWTGSGLTLGPHIELLR